MLETAMTRTRKILGATCRIVVGFAFAGVVCVAAYSILIVIPFTHRWVIIAELSVARTLRIDMSNTSWFRASLPGLDFSRLSLRKADFCRTDAVGANFSRADLTESDCLLSNWGSADLHSAIFRRARLAKAALVYADLRNADLSNADLTNCLLIGADLRGANLSGAICQWAVYSHTTRWPIGFDPTKHGMVLNDAPFDDRLYRR